MELKEAIAFGQYSGHESPQRILAERVIELELENAALRKVADLASDAVESGAIDECYLSLLCDAISCLPNA